MAFNAVIRIVCSVGCVMCHKLNGLNSRAFLRLLAAGAAAAALAGCSADATRLNNPFSNPFASQADPVVTGSVPSKIRSVAAARPSQAVSSSSLAAPAKTFVRPQAAYNAPAVSTADVTSSIARPATSSARASGWAAEGGTPIVAAQGETSAMLARRYGVPEDVLLRVNGFSSGSQVQPGSRLVIPVFNGGSRTALAAPAAARPPAAAAAKTAKPAAVAKAAPEEADDAPEVAQKPTAKPKLAAKPEAAKPAKAAVASKPAPAKVAAAPKVAAKPVAEAKPAAVAKTAGLPKIAAAPAKPEPVKTAKLAKPPIVEPKKPEVDKTPVASLPPVSTAPAAPAADAANPEFRWPARGRIIQGFKSGGNDGINIAVPEGTSVKAAEGGVVAYAGSELKGYGNLVLIRHPNGFVSAYANNGDIEVKRGDTVKRGQTIAKSGQSGNVSSPQLHFELRKGSTPVDPTNYLAGL